MADTLTFFHAPQSRSSGVAVLLDELQAPHAVRVLNMRAGEQRQPDFLAINPMGKVPAILHNGAIVTEQVAIFIYLADLFPQAGLTPAIHDPRRGPYLRWLAFYGASFEPAIVDRAMKREPAAVGTSPYASYEIMLETLLGQLRAGPYMTGDTITAADILWGVALRWVTMFKLLPDLPEITAYIERICSRPSFGRVTASDAKLAAEREAAGKG